MRLGIAIAEHDPNSGSSDSIRRTEQYVREAAAHRVDLLLLPETFPGRWRDPRDESPLTDVLELARQHGLHITCGYPEPATSGGVGFYNTVSICDPDGRELLRYRRTSPRHAPWIYRGGPLWDFDWVPGNELPVASFLQTTMGVLVCSEVYVPELARILALQGAEVMLFPSGVIRRSSELYETWRTVTRARAIENLAVTALCSTATPDTGSGLGLVCSPEDVLLDTDEPGVHVVDVDLDRIRWLRQEQDRLTDGPKPWRTKPGLLRDWRRSEVLSKYAHLFHDVQTSGRF